MDTRVSIDADCLVDDFKSISLKRWKSVKRKLEEGAPGCEPLSAELEGLWRITSGSFRCVYEERHHATFLERRVIEVAPRDSVYDPATINPRRMLRE